MGFSAVHALLRYAPQHTIDARNPAACAPFSAHFSATAMRNMPIVLFTCEDLPDAPIRCPTLVVRSTLSKRTDVYGQMPIVFATTTDYQGEPPQAVLTMAAHTEDLPTLPRLSFDNLFAQFCVQKLLKSGTYLRYLFITGAPLWPGASLSKFGRSNSIGQAHRTRYHQSSTGCGWRTTSRARVP